mmetsp:Transcript_6272/g.19787  ORF Transcript_6272/g.19787 Transcript_6272/m.19787 type:complete len:386 (-) Transcript_6272:72-1229(-)
MATVQAYAAGARLCVMGRAGAIVRQTADLKSDIVTTLASGTTARAYGQAQTITDDRGATKERVRLAEPVDGWLSAKMVAAAATADAAPSTAVQSTPEAAAPLARELEVAVSLARRAGAEIVRLRASGELNPTEKPNDEGPVTAADFAADRLISDGLREAFPGDCVVSEEGGECATDGDRAWYVDPLDGTRNFLGRAGAEASRDWCVMIGLCIEGAPALGVVHQPDTATTWTGVVGQGAEKRAGDRVEALPTLTKRTSGPLRFAASPPVKPRFPELVSRFTERAGSSAVWVGSAGLKAAAVADGAADFYPSSFRGMHLWDVCAGHALCAAVGGSFEALDGSPVAYARTGDGMVLSKGVMFAGPTLDEPLKSKVRAMYEWFRSSRRR